MTHTLTNTSLTKLQGIHPHLKAVILKAITLTEIDFIVLEGLRSSQRQRKLVDKGASQTMKSRHITGHAVDLGAYANGNISWDWKYYYKIADAVKKAAESEDIQIRWGGAWHTSLTQYVGTAKELSKEYTQLRKSQKRKVFLDGPHFELPKNLYPEGDR